MKPTLFILAAGMGSRYGGLKQLDGIGPSGETIMDYSIFDAIKAGFGKVVFVIRKDFEQDFRDKVLAKYRGCIETDVVFQSIDNLPAGFSVPLGREKPWGTNHAVLMGKDVIQEPFLVINADDFYGYDTFKKAAEFLSQDLKGNDYCMIGFKIGNTLSETGYVSRGICKVGDDGFLKKIDERKEIAKIDGKVQFKDENGNYQTVSDDTPVSMNAWGFTPDYFAYSEDYFKNVFLPASMGDLKSEFFIPKMIDHLIKNGMATVRCIETNAQWFGVTYAEDRPQVVQQLQQLTDQGYYPDQLFKC
jgi:choline kinase